VDSDRALVTVIARLKSVMALMRRKERTGGKDSQEGNWARQLSSERSGGTDVIVDPTLAPFVNKVFVRRNVVKYNLHMHSQTDASDRNKIIAEFFANLMIVMITSTFLKISIPKQGH
jgi:hypothetical protein